MRGRNGSKHCMAFLFKHCMAFLFLSAVLSARGPSLMRLHGFQEFRRVLKTAKK